MTDRHTDWMSDEVRPLALDRIDERLCRYRLVQPKVERKIAQSLERYGQVSPVVICLHDGDCVLIDGFKRLHAARTMNGLSRLWARRMDVDEQGAKAAIYNLNRVGQRPQELEESWIVQALVREDGLSVTGNRVAKRLALLLDCLAKMQSWLRYQGRGELQACDREPLETGLRRLVQECDLTGEASQGFLQELKLP